MISLQTLFRIWLNLSVVLAMSSLPPLNIELERVPKLLSGTYREKIPAETSKLTHGYFESLTFENDNQFTLLSTYYCPPGVTRPKSLLPIRPTKGNYILKESESSDNQEDRHLSITLLETVNSLGTTMATPRGREFQAGIEIDKDTVETIILREVKEPHKVHIMYRET